MSTSIIKGWFDHCTTIEQLNKERLRLMSDLNTEYGKQKELIMKRVPPFKTIPVIQASDLEPVKETVYTPFPRSASTDSIPENSIVFDVNGEIRY